MDDYRMDDHKLIFHPDRVSDWLRERPVYPVYIEICPHGGCNHRCTFCAYDYTKYRPFSLETGVLKSRIDNMADIGIKAIMYAGEGEPLLHKDISSIVSHTALRGIDAAITTNGVMLNREFAKRTLASITWIKVSINAGRPETHARLHGAGSKDFFKILDNLENSVRVRNENHYDCTIGAQALLLPENADELCILADRLRTIGVDYLVIKPFTEHPYRERERGDLKYDELFCKVKDQLSSFDSKGFNLIVRDDAFGRLEKEKGYRKCYSLDFWSYIDASGDVYACSNFLKNRDYSYGNIYEESFEKIWNKRKRVDVDLTRCRSICRMDKINQYLHELRHSPKHVNFI